MNDTAQHNAAPTRTGLWLAAVMALALVLRLIRLGYADLWHDEVHGFLKAEYLWSVWTTGEFVSNHPPMFVSLLRLWVELGLTGNEFNARLLTVLLGLAGVYAVYFTASRLVDARTGLIAAFLAAISPFLIHHAQDLKEYILLPIFCTWTAWTIYRAAETNRTRDWAVYGLSACLCCYADLFAGPFLVGVNLWFLFQLRGRANRLPGWFVANLLGAIAFLPVFFVLWRRFDMMIVDAPQIWIPHPGLIEAVIFAKTIAFGYSAMDPAWKIALLLTAVLALAGLALAFRIDWRLGLLMFCWMILPVAATFAASHFRQSIFLYRGLIWAAVPVYIAVALAVARNPRLPWRVAALAALVALTSLSLWQKYAFQYTPDEFPHRPAIHPPRQYEAAANFVLENWQEGDGVIQGSTSGWHPFMYYGLRGKPHVSAAPKRRDIDFTETNYPRTTHRADWAGYYPRVPSEAVSDQKRIWFVFEDWERVYYQPNVMPVWRYLDSRFPEIGHWTFGDLELFLYDTGPGLQNAARISDNGAEIALRRTGSNQAYVQRMPDTGLVASPIETRRGALALAFTDAAGESIPIGDASGARTISFAAANRAGEPVNARLMIVPSDALVDAATLTPEDRVDTNWTINAAYNPAPPPDNHEMAVAVAHVHGERTEAIAGPAPLLPPGTYATAVYYMGLPNRPEYLNAPLTLTVGPVDLLAQLEPADDGPAWRWLPGAPVVIGDPAPATIRAVAAPLPGEPDAYANLGFIAFRRTEDAAPSPLPLHDEPVVIPPGGRAWSAQIDPAAARLDVFLLEYGADGRAYRIYRRFDLE